MSRSRRIWVAVAVYAALMTVAEAYALHAAVRDARRWLEGDQAHGLRHATAIVTRVVRDNLLAKDPEIRVIRREALPTSECDAVLTGMRIEPTNAREARRLAAKAIAIEI